VPRAGLPPSNNGRPPRKDANEMSISMESSRSSLAQQQAHFASQNNSGHSEDMLGISRELSRDRMQLSNNPFTSSGSFNFSSASFSGTSSLTSSSGGVAAIHQNGGGVHHHGAHGANNVAASRYRMAQDIGRGSVPEGDEYAEDKFEDDEDEEVHRYDDAGYSGYDYKAEEKKSSGNYQPSRGYK
jgi:hypothetical protein